MNCALGVSQVSAHPLSRYLTADAPFEATAVKGFDCRDESLWIPECRSFSCYKNEVNPLVLTALEWRSLNRDLTFGRRAFPWRLSAMFAFTGVWRLIRGIHCCSATGLAIIAPTVTDWWIRVGLLRRFVKRLCVRAVASSRLRASPETRSRTSALALRAQILGYCSERLVWFHCNATSTLLCPNLP